MPWESLDSSYGPNGIPPPKFNRKHNYQSRNHGLNFNHQNHNNNYKSSNHNSNMNHSARKFHPKFQNFQKNVYQKVYQKIDNNYNQTNEFPVKKPIKVPPKVNSPTLTFRLLITGNIDSTVIKAKSNENFTTKISNKKLPKNSKLEEQEIVENIITVTGEKRFIQTEIESIITSLAYTKSPVAFLIPSQITQAVWDQVYDNFMKNKKSMPVTKKKVSQNEESHSFKATSTIGPINKTCIDELAKPHPSQKLRTHSHDTEKPKTLNELIEVNGTPLFESTEISWRIVSENLMNILEITRLILEAFDSKITDLKEAGLGLESVKFYEVEHAENVGRVNFGNQLLPIQSSDSSLDFEDDVYLDISTDSEFSRRSWERAKG